MMCFVFIFLPVQRKIGKYCDVKNNNIFNMSLSLRQYPLPLNSLRFDVANKIGPDKIIENKIYSFLVDISL